MLPERASAELAPRKGVLVTPGYRGGHGVFSIVAGPNGAAEPERRLIDWAMYLLVPEDELAGFFTDATAQRRVETVAPGSVPVWREESLRRQARELLPSYYAEIVERSCGTSAHAICDCKVPAYRTRRICLTGDAAAVARPHTASGALKSINNAVALATALTNEERLDIALWNWNLEQTAAGNRLVHLGRQLGDAFVTNAVDYSTMDAMSMKQWFESIITIRHEVFAGKPAANVAPVGRPRARRERAA